MNDRNLTVLIPERELLAQGPQVELHFAEGKHREFANYIADLEALGVEVDLHEGGIVPNQSYLIAEGIREMPDGDKLRLKVWGPDYDVKPTERDAREVMRRQAQKAEDAERERDLAEAEEEARERELAAREEGVGGRDDPETAHDSSF